MQPTGAIHICFLNAAPDPGIISPVAASAGARRFSADSAAPGPTGTEERNLAEEVHALRAEIAGARVSSSSTPSSSGRYPLPQRRPRPERQPMHDQRGKCRPRTAGRASGCSRTGRRLPNRSAAQRMPITLAGMVLFNSFINSRSNGGARPGNGFARRQCFARQRQALDESVGVSCAQGPRILGGQVRGSIDLDLWGGSTNSLNHWCGCG